MNLENLERKGTVKKHMRLKVCGAAGGTEQRKQNEEVCRVENERKHVDRSCADLLDFLLGALSVVETFERIWEDILLPQTGLKICAT